jgi:hypothetical protein
MTEKLGHFCCTQPAVAEPRAQARLRAYHAHRRNGMSLNREPAFRVLAHLSGAQIMVGVNQRCDAGNTTLSKKKSSIHNSEISETTTDSCQRTRVASHFRVGASQHTAIRRPDSAGHGAGTSIAWQVFSYIFGAVGLDTT